MVYRLRVRSKDACIDVGHHSLMSFLVAPFEPLPINSAVEDTGVAAIEFQQPIRIVASTRARPSRSTCMIQETIGCLSHFKIIMITSTNTNNRRN